MASLLVSPGTASPIVSKMKVDQGDNRSASRSPAPFSPHTVPPTKPHRSPLLPTPTVPVLTSKASQSVEGSQKTSPVVRNGEKQLKVARSRSRSPSRSKSPKPSQSHDYSHSPSLSKRSPPPPNLTRSSSSRSPSPSSPPQTFKPIHSPIKVSSSDHSGHSYTSPVAHTSSGQENGIPEQYRSDYENDRRVRKSRHKHRSEKRRHRRRSISRDREHHRRRHDRGREKEREYNRGHRSRDRDRSRGRDRRRMDVYRR